MKEQEVSVFGYLITIWSAGVLVTIEKIDDDFVRIIRTRQDRCVAQLPLDVKNICRVKKSANEFIDEFYKICSKTAYIAPAEA